MSQGMTVGYMNPDYILDQLPEKEEIERQLDEFLNEREQDFQEEAIEYQNLLGQVQEQADQMSDQELQRQQQQLQAMEQELQQLQMQIEREFEQRRNDLLQPLLNEMNEYIAEIAAEKDLDYVINEESSEGELFILHVSAEGQENYNLTDQVLQRMLNN